MKSYLFGLAIQVSLVLSIYFTYNTLIKSISDFEALVLIAWLMVSAMLSTARAFWRRSRR